MDIQLQVTDKELEEFPEEKSDQIGITITNIKAMKSQRTTQIDTWLATQHYIATQPAGKEPPNQPSNHIPLLLSLHIQPDLQALTWTHAWSSQVSTSRHLHW